MSEADGVGLTQRDLLMEMREDIKGLKATVDAFARAMGRSLDSASRRESLPDVTGAPHGGN